MVSRIVGSLVEALLLTLSGGWFGMYGLVLGCLVGHTVCKVVVRFVG